jgi:hypothetical protein
MQPKQLTAASFQKYPPEARALAEQHLALLQRLPLSFLPLLLRELIVYDWKFPAERADLTRQFAYLAKYSETAMSPFAELKLTHDLEQTDWVNNPAIFSEQLSAHLWATHQIDTFRAAAVDYVRNAAVSSPDPPPPTHRLGIAIIGQGVSRTDYRLFRKLRKQGLYYTQVNPAEGVKTILETAAARAEAHPIPYAHWYIDGAQTQPAAPLTTVSYTALSVPRAVLQTRMQKAYEAPVFDPEAFRTMLAQLQPDQVNLSDTLLNRFQLTLLTEGSGTQVFATTFVQWAAREALRRAQPLTLVTRFTPRQRENQMNELLAEHHRNPELDPEGSLIDADMGAYYTWLNQQRLPGAEKSCFLVWFEGHNEALAIAPTLPRGTSSETPIALPALLATLL